MSTDTSADHLVQQSSGPMTLAWALKQTAILILILVVAMGSMAWLTYASIDPVQETDAGPTDARQPVTNVRLSL